MAQTQLLTGSPQTRKLYSVALFAEVQRQPSFRKNITGPAPKQAEMEAKLRGESSPDYPIVNVLDLTKTAGDTVDVDLVNVVTGKPVMGDQKLAGNMMALSFSSQNVSINQYRYGVDPGGRMSQQRTLIDLRGAAMANLSSVMNRLEDQLCMVHLAGARGYQNDNDWVVPLAADPDFATICVNPVVPPTPLRRFFAGGNTATSVANMNNTMYLQLNDIDLMRALIEENPFPLQPIRIADDPAKDEQPLYVLYVTPRVWYFLETQTSGQNWRNFLAQAYERARGWNHPLFLGSPGMWNGILVKKTARAIRFNAGSLVGEYADTTLAVINQNAAAVATDRCLLLGGQALANVYGRSQKSGYFFNYNEEETDHGNTIEISAAAMGGKAKLRFQGSDGYVNDHGVYTIDCYAPVP